MNLKFPPDYCIALRGVVMKIHDFENLHVSGIELNCINVYQVKMI